MGSFLLSLLLACTTPVKDPEGEAPYPVTGDSGDTEGPVEGAVIDVGPGATLPLRILPLGDSITEYGYRYDLWTRLVDAGWSFNMVGSMSDAPLLDGQPHDWPTYAGQSLDPDHEGHAGWTSTDILQNPGTWDQDRGSLQEWLLSTTPDVALIHLGTNDAFYEENTDHLTNNLATIIAALRRDNPRVRIHLAQIIPLVHEHWQGGTYDRWVRDYNAHIPELATALSTESSPIVIVDQYSGFDGYADTYDLIHPNAAGDAKVATRWWESLESTLAPVPADDDYSTSAADLQVAPEEGLLANDRGARGSARVELLVPPTLGSLSLRSDGGFSYTGAGTDQFTYRLNDGVATSAAATVRLCAGPGCADQPPSGYFVDCSAGDDVAAGDSPATAWRSLARLAEEPLGPGDAVWFLAGSTCTGTLHLSGSGSAAAPIRVGAWGEGLPPRIRGEGEAALRLEDQSFVTVEGLEIEGGSRWGIYVTTTGQVQGITLRNLEVHGVHGAGGADAKATGLVVFTVSNAAAWFEDVVVEDVVAWDSNMWAGIFLYGTAWREGGPRSRNILFRNNVVHDVAGDGIVVFGAEDVLMEGNLAYECGQIQTDAVGTPNAIWTWDCQQCTVQFNEAHHTHSPGNDGGAFDIDWDNVDNVVQYNYGHHNDGYCVAVFAAEGSTTRGSVVRYNLCLNNGQGEDQAFQGDIYLTTWNGGSLGDVQVYNNTVRRSAGWPALVVLATPGAGSGIWNNIFVTERDWLATIAGEVELGNNLWWTTADQAWFDDGGAGWYDGVAAWERAGGGAGNLSADPVLVGGFGKAGLQLGAGSPAIDAGKSLDDPGLCDGFGSALSGDPDVGAHQFGGQAAEACGVVSTAR